MSLFARAQMTIDFTASVLAHCRLVRLMITERVYLFIVLTVATVLYMKLRWPVLRIFNGRLTPFSET